MLLLAKETPTEHSALEGMPQNRLRGCLSHMGALRDVLLSLHVGEMISLCTKFVNCLETSALSLEAPLPFE